MPVPASERPAWRRVAKGLAFARRGIALTAASGCLILLLGATGRAGCANPALSEVRSLMQYQDLLFHAALWLGFSMAVGGLLWTSLLPATGRERLLPAVVGALAGAALVVTAAVATPGRLPALDAPPRDAGPLVAAVLGTAGLGASALVAMLVCRRLGAPGRVRRAAWFGLALLPVAAVNAEAASGILFPAPLASLYALGAVAAVNAAAGLWLLGLLSGAEALIAERLADPAPGADPDLAAHPAPGADPDPAAHPAPGAGPDPDPATQAP